MSVLVRPVLGVPIIKPAVPVPHSTTATIFTATGPVILNLLIGLVTTAFSGASGNLNIGVAGSSAFASFVSFGNYSAGFLIFCAAGNSQIVTGGNVLNLQTLGIGYNGQSLAPLFAGGSITWTTTANVNGAVDWYAWYTPIGSGSLS